MKRTEGGPTELITSPRRLLEFGASDIWQDNVGGYWNSSALAPGATA
jgi:hypothetical protein